ncbi:hypothetical protein [Streptomyces sp. NPDC048489]|uniref:hypothetical protein n=1 Tax=Streptomyces sp. NPDC048489 TaxID=3154504 RepID=UPI0034428394
MATVIHFASRRLAGWVIAGQKHTSLVTDALTAAEPASLAGAIMHIEHGARYTGRAFTHACHQSMSAIETPGAGTPASDNAAPLTTRRHLVGRTAARLALHMVFSAPEHLVQRIRNGLRHIQYRSNIIDGSLAKTLTVKLA